MSGKVAHAVKPASSSITTQAQSSEFQREVDKDPANSLQPPLWQAGVQAADSSPVANTNTGHNFTHIPVLSSASINVQPKLTVGEPNDKYEQEADQVAEQVMRMPEPILQGRPDDNDDEEKQGKIQTKPLSEQITPLIQRQTSVEEEDSEPVQPKPLIQRQVQAEDDDEEETAQTKLVVQRQTEDEGEDEEPIQTKPLIQGQDQQEEEDEEETAQTKFVAQRQAEGEEDDEEPVQTKSSIQRQEQQEEEDEEKTVRTKSVGAKTPKLDRNSENYINSIPGRGQPLPDGERNFFEPRFGHNFGRVRIHADGQSASAARQIKSQAFTVGHNIFFGANRYQPGSATGRQLLAHELTHTIQQTGRSPLPGQKAESRVRQWLVSTTKQNLDIPVSSVSVSNSNATHLFHVSDISRPSTNNLSLVMRRTDPAEQITDESDSIEDLVEWIVDFLKKNPEDSKGVVNSRLAMLDAKKMTQVMTQVQKRMAVEKPLPKSIEGKEEREDLNDKTETETIVSEPENNIEQERGSETAEEAENKLAQKPDKKAEESTDKLPEEIPEEITNELTEEALGEKTEEPVATPEEEIEQTTAESTDGAVGKTEKASAQVAGGAAGGGGGTLLIGSGEEFQGGTVEEGESEIEQRLADADPERAAADEIDPADLALDEPQEKEEDTLTVLSAPEPDIENTPDNLDSNENSAISEDLTDEEPSEDTDLTEVDEIEDTEPAVTGISSDEPALGGSVELEASTAELSSAEQNAALESVGQSVGGSGPSVGGGGAGTPLPEPAPVPVPDVSALEPGAALSKAGSLPPARLKQALGGVGTAVSKSAGDKRGELAANPPQKERPSGAPKNLHSKREAGTKSEDKAAKKVEQTPEGSDKPTPEPKPFAEPPPSPAEKISEPQVSGSEKGEMTERDIARMSSSLSRLPTRDPGLNATAGPAPRVELSGNADPAQADTQRGELRTATTENHAQGKRDAAEEMGENTKVFPNFAPETLIAELPASGGGGAATAGGAGGGGNDGGGAKAAGGAGGKDSEAISIIAQEEKGSEIQAEVVKAQSDMTSKQEEYTTSVTEENAKSNEEIAALETQSSQDQAKARAEVQSEVQGKKGEWTEEQDKTVSDAEKEADGKVAKGKEDIRKEKETADKGAAKEIDKGNKEVDKERKKAEQKAKEEKQKGKKKKSGFFGWLASKAKAFFNKIKSAIKSAFDFARKMIKKAIEAAKKAAMWAIEQARKAIVAAIKLVGKALIAIGDKLLAAFPEMRDRFRKYIQDKVDKAVNKVNEYAEKLKKDVAEALDALAAGLDKLIGWLEKGLLAVVDGVAAAVNGAIKFAEKVAQAIGAFLSLIKDVASSPLKWLSNLGAAVVDGIRNHLWKAFKAAVQEWFNSKLEQVLGLGKMVWDLIKSGGLALAKVGKMAWEGIKAMIPMALINILVEKLVALIVPAAGAVMVIIEGLQAAWGAVSRIIAAFQAFFAFLKAVKTGAAGPKFATALAAAAIAVIDFIANWLILKLAKGAAKIGGKIKGLAKKILGRKKGRARGRKAKAKLKSKTKKPIKTKKAKPKPSAKTRKPKKSKADKKRDKKNKKKKDKAKKVRKGLAAIDRAERKYLKEGTIEKKDAQKVARSVKRRHRVFKILKVVDGGETWDYDYVASPGRKKRGEKKRFSTAKEKFKKQIKTADLYAQSDLVKVIERRDKEFRKKNWNSVKIAIQKDGRFSKIYNKPTLKQHDFGRRHHSDQLKPAYEKAAQKKGFKVKNLDAKVNARKPQIHQGGANFGLALKSLRGQIFNGAKYFKTAFKNLVDGFVKVLGRRHTRRTEYPSSFSSGVWQKVVDKHRSASDKNNNIYRDYKGDPIDRKNISIDHEKAVVVHWKQTGHNTSRAARNAWYNDIKNLRVMHKVENSAEGAIIGTKHKYSDVEIGKNYSQ